MPCCVGLETPLNLAASTGGGKWDWSQLKSVQEKSLQPLHGLAQMSEL